MLWGRVANRGTIHLEDARVLQQTAYDGNQFVLRVQAPKCAARAEPGSFAHLTCDPSIPMRRPLFIMRANADAGWIDLLYKIVGTGFTTFDMADHYGSAERRRA